MGYSTNFSGSVNIEPPLAPNVVEQISQWCGERHDGHPIGIWCDWAVSPDGRSIEWNGSEKSYNMDEWMRFLLDTYVVPAGSVANGTVEAHGEEPADRWRIIVVENVVYRQEYVSAPSADLRVIT